MGYYRRVLVFIYWMLLQLTALKAFAKLIDLPTKVGSAVHFHLPPFTECGYYNLTDSEQTLVLTVFNQSKPTTSDTYRRRSTVESLRNGTILFTLHFISWQDEGLFTMQTPITRCQWNYSLRLIKEETEHAFWEEWNSWSTCSTSCGPGLRTRDRVCTTDGGCGSQTTHTEACDTDNVCPFWGRWSDWSPCSVTCGTGETDRRRVCRNDKERLHDSACSGNSTDRKSCVENKCQGTDYFWSSWSEWSSCSTSCGGGNSTRMRKCQFGNTLRDIPAKYCHGAALERHECRKAQCLKENEEQPLGSGTDSGTTDSPTPYSTIIGGTVAAFIIILLLVIIVLLVHLKRKKDTAVRRRTIYDPQNINKRIDVRSSRAKSNIVQSEAESQMYAEIDDDFIDSEFDATSCNDYCALPASPSRRSSVQTKKISCDQTSAGGSVFVFDATAANLNVPKTGTRSRKLDSQGYEKPITTAEKRRNVTYLNTAYEISDK